MTDWQRTLNLLPEWKQAQSGEITPQQLAGVVKDRLLALRPFGNHLDEAREELAELFGDFARADDVSVSEFDSLMSDLYDWADTSLDNAPIWARKKACWVKTFGEPQ